MISLSLSDITPYNLDLKCLWHEIPYTCGSDYSGDTVTASNYRVLKRQLSRYRGIADISGWFDGYGLAYAPSLMTARGRKMIAYIIDKLNQYPAIDDEDASGLERDIIMEYVEDAWHYDRKRVLPVYYLAAGIPAPEDIDDTDDTTEATEGLAYDQWLGTIMSGIGNFAITETGGVPYISMEKALAAYLISVMHTRSELKGGTK
jgi:hypothetical protein